MTFWNALVKSAYHSMEYTATLSEVLNEVSPEIIENM